MKGGKHKVVVETLNQCQFIQNRRTSGRSPFWLRLDEEQNGIQMMVFVLDSQTFWILSTIFCLLAVAFKELLVAAFAFLTGKQKDCLVKTLTQC